MITTAQAAELKAATLKNILEKIAAGGVPTKREEEIIAASTAAEKTPTLTLRKLAQAVGCDHKMFGKWRAKYPDAPSENDPEQWNTFLKATGLHTHSVRQNAPLPKVIVDGDQANESPVAEEQRLRLQERRLKVERETFELRKAKAEMVPNAHIEAALGAMLAKFRQALDGLIGRIVGGIDEADKDELVKLLTRAEKEGLTFKKLRSLVSRGTFRFADIHARREFVQSEVDALKRTLTQCEYMEADPDADED